MKSAKALAVFAAVVAGLSMMQGLAPASAAKPHYKEPFKQTCFYDAAGIIPAWYCRYSPTSTVYIGPILPSDVAAAKQRCKDLSRAHPYGWYEVRNESGTVRCRRVR